MLQGFIKFPCFSLRYRVLKGVSRIVNEEGRSKSLIVAFVELSICRVEEEGKHRRCELLLSLPDPFPCEDRAECRVSTSHSIKSRQSVGCYSCAFTRPRYGIPGIAIVIVFYIDILDES